MAFIKLPSKPYRDHQGWGQTGQAIDYQDFIRRNVVINDYAEDIAINATNIFNSIYNPPAPTEPTGLAGIWIYGGGEDGDVTLGAGTVMSANAFIKFYRNLNLAGFTLESANNEGGICVFVSEILTLASGTIKCGTMTSSAIAGVAGNAGGGASGGTGTPTGAVWVYARTISGTGTISARPADAAAGTAAVAATGIVSGSAGTNGNPGIFWGSTNITATASSGGGAASAAGAGGAGGAGAIPDARLAQTLFDHMNDIFLAGLYNPTASGGQYFGRKFLMPTGSSGGSGGGNNGGAQGSGGGGGGGGGISAASRTTNGITGGTGAAGTAGASGAGGGGGGGGNGGGTVTVVSDDCSNDLTIDVTGGAGGAGASGNGNGGAGGGGSGGRGGKATAVIDLEKVPTMTVAGGAAGGGTSPGTVGADGVARTFYRRVS